jgi:hypothetical protein
MTYYLLPKTKHFISLKLTCQEEPLKTYTSHSLSFFYDKLVEQLFTTVSLVKQEKEKEKETEDDYLYGEDIETISQFFHPYEYIFKKIPFSKHTVSKLPFKEAIFYDFYEIVKSIHLLDDFHKKKISLLTIGKHSVSIQECMKFLRANIVIKEEMTCCNSLEEVLEKNVEKEEGEKKEGEKKEEEKKEDFLFFELLEKGIEQGNNTPILRMIQVIIILLSVQKNNGIAIIQIDHTFYKPILDLIYLLSSFYEKIYIIKPMASNLVSFHKYLVCKYFIDDPLKHDSYKKTLISFLHTFNDSSHLSNSNISSLMEGNLPCFFISKINDINIILGQQQLEMIHQMILFFKNKNKEKKSQLIKMHIAKSIKWCEKFKIPHGGQIPPPFGTPLP